ncbi:MAG: UDP-N-acetylglucosamine 2-epimerase (non-hydrolyzing) [Chloroflexi bacterium HGW-Chloroflexi-2]|jgi:UDP-N-acetylglucosamine 2-epimerase (non-hydrolysing)|nr:MAG: UDP-N-acetylglucosamine 2-epimerase (non-hydrolyzing) [Chloroflexi bacterium HGW-Chloroflexi-2]
MTKIRLLNIIGTRPEAVKMCPVIQVAQSHPDIEPYLCVTAQHRQMLDQVLSAFNIAPDFDLNLMQPDQSLAQITASILQNLDPILKEIKPDWILVQGDTTTVMTSALLAFYNRIKIGHVEAGLRTGDKWQPFPEEINRKIAGVVADLHLAPTEEARQNLLNEGVEDWRIAVTGNPAIDALRIITSQPSPDAVQKLFEQHHIGLGQKKLILVTAHRRENFGQPILDICTALKTLADRYKNQYHMIYPVHLNPNIQEPVYRLLGDVENITLLPPLDYLPMAHLLKHAVLVLTDSGGIQEEAAGLHKPALVLREVTERPEGVKAGVLRLVGTDPERIVSNAIELLEDKAVYKQMAQSNNPFGDGYAAEKIINALVNIHSNLNSEFLC